jgi:hypothetical protein
MPRPAIPANLMQNIRSAVSTETNSPQPMFSPLFTESLADRIRQFVMPYSVATFASLVIGVSLFFLIGSPESNPLEIAISEKSQNSTVLMTNSNIGFEDLNLGQEDFPKISLTKNPPTLNPTGALVALTKSFVRGKMKDEEVVIVADVFSNGLARVSEVVEPSKDEQTMLEIQKAFESDPEDASFLPAKADNRSDKVTFIFKIQRVDVKYQKPAKKKHK